MKKLIMILTCLLLFTICNPVYGAKRVESSEIEYCNDGSYFETVITTESNSGMTILSSKNTVTKTKTSYYKNSSGTTLWYVKVTGTFTYGNESAKCTSSSVTAESKSGAWKITSKSASKSGNKATAKATAKRYYDGSVVETKYKTVTLTCSPSGNFS
ncbi:MAG: hypothetical protein Q4C46_12715 [Bacillota bacterium]|nr:hypothetical protein [Bacillota bacterium]